ncbi:hypothetical protein PRIPAC_75169 [Pristionchus pacificus]|nr:hypothetical protein PRIPAC_75169 [Pristionchus pacificus]
MTTVALSIVHYAICSLGLIINAVLLFVITTRTPAKMRTYGAVLATSTIVDLLALASSTVTFVKCEASYIETVTGPCIFTRLYAIRNGALSERATFIAVAIILFPNVLDVIVFAQSDMLSSDAVRALLIQQERPVDENFMYFKYRDDANIVNMISLSSLIVPFPIAYVVIIIVLLRIRKALADATGSMSAKTKEAHVEIIKARSADPILLASPGCLLNRAILKARKGSDVKSVAPHSTSH